MMTPPPPTTLSLSLFFFLLVLGTIGITSIHGFHLLPIPPSTSSRPSQPHTKQQRRDLSFFSGSSSYTSTQRVVTSSSPLSNTGWWLRDSCNSRLFVASSSAPQPEEEEQEEDKEKEESSVASSASSVDNDNNKNFNFKNFNLLPKFDNVLIANAVSLGIVILFVFVGFNLLSNGLSIASSAVMDEIGREVMNLLGSLASLLLALGGVILKLLQYVIPVVGKGISNGVTIATPVIQEAYQTKVVESQLIQDATTAVNQATAPIVDTVTQTVDTNVVAPIQDLTNTVQTQLNHAVDTNIVTPIKTATDSLTDSVSGAVDSNIVTPVKEATDSITGTVTHIFDSTLFSFNFLGWRK